MNIKIFENCNTCSSQVKIFKHPWNKEEWSKGSVNELLGYGCKIRDSIDNDSVIYFFSKESFATGCEMHSKRVS